MASVISVMIILAASLATGTSFITFSSSNFSEQAKADYLKVSNTKVWYDNDAKSSAGTVIVHNDGDKEVQLSTLTIRGKDIPYTQWYYSKANGTSTQLFNNMTPATTPLFLKQGETAAIYFTDNNTNITPLDVGSTSALHLRDNVVSTSISSGALDIIPQDGTQIFTTSKTSSNNYVKTATTATQLAFTNAPHTPNAGQSVWITVQQQDSSGTPVQALQPVTVNLSTTSSGGVFLASSTSTTPITSVTIQKGSSSVSFKYEDTATGTPTITASSTGLTSATQTETVGPAKAATVTVSPSTVTLTATSPSQTQQFTAKVTDQFGNVRSKDTIIWSVDSGGVGTITSIGLYSAGQTPGTAAVRATDTTPSPSISGTAQVTVIADTAAATPSKLVFTTAPQTLTAGSLSSQMTIQTQDSSGNPSNVNAATTVSLSSSSSAGTFYSDAAGTIQITSLTIVSGSNSASFYYKDTAAGSPTITASSTGLTSATQTETINTSSLTSADVGVNFHGYYIERPTGTLPINYFDDSFKTLHNAGFTTVRLPIFWESYVSNPTAFTNELKVIAQTAQNYNMKVIYDNHKYHTSSWLYGTNGLGFPSFLFNSTQYPQGSYSTTDKTFWENWWNRKIVDIYGNDGWTDQVNFMKVVVAAVDSYQSTVGYEILNEPPVVNSTSDWSNIGTYDSFIVNELRTVTQKMIFFSMTLPVPKTVTELEQMSPVPANNIAFDGHLYEEPTPNSYGLKKMNLFVTATKALGIPLYIGEWNNGTSSTSNTNQTVDDVFVQTFKNDNVYGWAYWDWQWKHYTSLNPAYQLITVTSANTIQTTVYYDYLSNSLKTYYLS